MINKNDNLSSIIYNELKKQSNTTNTNKYFEYGSVISVKDGVVQAYGLLNVQAGELVEFVDSKLKYLVLYLEKAKIGCLFLKYLRYFFDRKFRFNFVISVGGLYKVSGFYVFDVYK